MKESLQRCNHIHLTFQTSGVKLNEELGPARCLYYGLNALELDVGLLWRLWQTCAEVCGQEGGGGRWKEEERSVWVVQTGMYLITHF